MEPFERKVLSENLPLDLLFFMLHWTLPYGQPPIVIRTSWAGRQLVQPCIPYYRYSDQSEASQCWARQDIRPPPRFPTPRMCRLMCLPKQRHPRSRCNHQTHIAGCHVYLCHSWKVFWEISNKSKTKWVFVKYKYIPHPRLWLLIWENLNMKSKFHV